jgi:hypothetical protein
MQHLLKLSSLWMKILKMHVPAGIDFSAFKVSKSVQRKSLIGVHNYSYSVT